jgi:hypothetical protein
MMSFMRISSDSIYYHFIVTREVSLTASRCLHASIYICMALACTCVLLACTCVLLVCTCVLLACTCVILARTCVGLACTCMFLTRTPVLLACTCMVLAPVIYLQSRKAVCTPPTLNTDVGCDSTTASSIPKVCLQQLCQKVMCGESVAGTCVGLLSWLRSDCSNYVN